MTSACRYVVCSNADCGYYETCVVGSDKESKLVEQKVCTQCGSELFNACPNAECRKLIQEWPLRFCPYCQLDFATVVVLGGAPRPKITLHPAPDETM